MLKLDNNPSFQALTMNVSGWPCASTGCYMQIFIIFLHQSAKSTIDVDDCPPIVEVVVVDEASISHKVILNVNIIIHENHISTLA